MTPKFYVFSYRIHVFQVKHAQQRKSPCRKPHKTLRRPLTTGLAQNLCKNKLSVFLSLAFKFTVQQISYFKTLRIALFKVFPSSKYNGPARSHTLTHFARHKEQ
jgi:hypothetical protein